MNWSVLVENFVCNEAYFKLYLVPDSELMKFFFQLRGNVNKKFKDSEQVCSILLIFSVLILTLIRPTLQYQLSLDLVRYRLIPPNKGI